MKITYDAEVDVLRILFSGNPIEESDEDKPGVILDYDKDGNIVGMEVLDASKRVKNPRQVGVRGGGIRSAVVTSETGTMQGQITSSQGTTRNP